MRPRIGLRRTLCCHCTGTVWEGAQAIPTPTYSPPTRAQGYRAQNDIIDGYRFFYPEGWLAVSSSGNDCFLRNPRNIDENCFVDITSPSSSTFSSVADLGTPEQTAKRTLDKYLTKEFMSTRIGIRREGSVLFANSRQGVDGRTYYDIGVRMSSYGSTNPYVATQVCAPAARVRAVRSCCVPISYPAARLQVLGWPPCPGWA